jgi:hypothetical protein
MNYSRALRGSLTRSGAINKIILHADIELGRPLSSVEEGALFEKFSPQSILDRIQKVSS